MSGLSISGYGVVCAAGRAPADLLQTGDVRVDVRGRYAEPLPHPTAAVADVDVRAELGRKGTSFLDRATVLTLVACGDALRDAGLDLDAVDLARVGVVLGTTTGSLKSTMDYCCDTLTQERPYLVNPVLFPNTVMNCAAGQTAIWFGLRGLNATVAGGPVAFLHALRYATGALRRGYADMLLTGAVEEFTPHTAWDTALTGRAPAGEAAAVFAVAASPAGPRDADLLAVTAGFDPGGARGGLTGCVRRALAAADVDPAEVHVLATGDDPGEAAEAAAGLDGNSAELLRVTETFGECQAASGALALAAVLARHRVDPALDGRPAVLTGRSRDGAVAAAVVRGWSRVGVDHR